MKIIKEARLQESAFMVGEKTLSDIVELIDFSKKAYAKVSRVLKGQSLFKALIDLNIESLTNRYKDPESMYIGVEKYKPVRASPDFIQQIKSLQAYLYQCSEADKNPLYKALREILAMPVVELVEDTPEYDKGYWGN